MNITLDEKIEKWFNEVDMDKIIKVGQVSNEGSQSGSVYSTVGLFPTVCACTHGYAIGNIMEIKSVDMSKSREGNKVYNNMRECVNMYKKELLKFKFNMEEVRIFDVFSGIGALHQAHKELGVPTKIIALSEIDIDAIISYASIHIDNFNEIEFDYPSEDEMRELLIDRGIGYSCEKNKSSIPRLKKDKLYKVYKASILLNNLGDISRIDHEDLPDFDMMNFSFACTDISNAGKRKGMRNEDGTPTRSGLYIYGIKAIRSKKPKYVMIENVKALIQKKFIDDFYSIINELEEIGYNCYYPTKEDNKGNKIPTCLNTKNFGVPQNRERIFVYAIRKDVNSETFEFNYGFESDIRLKHILEDYIEDKYYLSDEIQKRFTPNGNLDINRNELNMVGSTAPKFRTIGQGDMVYAINGVISTLTATDYKQLKQIIDDKYYITEAHKKYLIKKRDNWAGSKKSCINKEITSTITRREGSVGCDVSNYICRDLNENCNISNRDVADFRIRRLTPKECWRLQGFRDECFDKAKAMGISDSSLYKQAGNSITVDVIYWNLLNLYKDFLN